MAFDKLILLLRKLRVWHRYLGLFLLVLLVISAATGILLSLKKEISWIQPPTQKAKVHDLSRWKTLSKLSETALQSLHEQQISSAPLSVSKIDVRPSKGIVKVLFKDSNWEVQLDGSTGKVLSIEKRYSDFIESIHDGSIISDGFKLFSMNVLGWGVLVLSLSGFFLWYGPRRIRRLKRKRKAVEKSEK